MCNLHHICFVTTIKKGKRSNNNCNLKNNEDIDGNNNKEEKKCHKIDNLVSTHIVPQFKGKMEMIHDINDYYTKDKGKDDYKIFSRVQCEMFISYY